MKSKLTTLVVRIFISLAVCSQHVAASGQPANGETQLTIRMLPVGQAPLVKVLADEDGKLREEEVDPALIPPAHLYVQGRDGNPAQVSLSLNTTTHKIELGRPRRTLDLFTKSPGQFDRLGSIPLTGGMSDLLILLHPAPGRPQDWAEPGFKVLRSDGEAFPAHSIRLINLTDSQLEVAFEDGQGPIVVKPLKSHLHQVSTPGQPLRYMAGVRQRDKFTRIAFTAALLNPGQRANLIVYPVESPYQGKNARFLFRVEDVATFPRDQRLADSKAAGAR